MLAVDIDPQAMKAMQRLFELSPAPLSLFNAHIVDNIENEQEPGHVCLALFFGGRREQGNIF